MIVNYAGALLKNLELLDIFGECNESEQFIIRHISNSNNRRTLPSRESRSQGRLQQLRDHHTTSTIRIAEGLID